MPYWKLYYHLIWATAHRVPLITPRITGDIYRLLRAKAVKLKGNVFEINGMPDHIHMVVAIPPAISVASFIGQVKGVCSAAVNANELSGTPFYWQEEYGAFSFDRIRLPNYLAYVQRQQEHHANGTVIPILEQVSNDATIISEEEALYIADDERWRQEMCLL